KTLIELEAKKANQAEKTATAAKREAKAITSKIPTLKQLAAIRKSEAADLARAAKLSAALSSEYQKAVAKMNAAATSLQNLNTKKLLGKKLSDVEQQELKQSTAEFNKYHTAVTGADASVKRFNRNVGNYPKGMMAAANA